MFIAFDGPDKTGKSTSAAALAHDGQAHYNVTKEMHRGFQNELWTGGQDLVVTYDRIDWFTHMVYRLAMPEKEWNDPRVRTVFAMPDTHLVVKLHVPELALLIDDELYETGKLAEVNPMYYWFTDFFMALNRQREYALFRSVSIVEVMNDPSGAEPFTQRLAAHDSPSMLLTDDLVVDSDDALLAFLREVDHHTL